MSSDEISIARDQAVHQALQFEVSPDIDSSVVPSAFKGRQRQTRVLQRDLPTHRGDLRGLLSTW